MSKPRIKPRKINFDFESVPRYWYDGDPLKTAYMNALSLSFPAGEKFFVDSVKNLQHQVRDETLRAQIKGFIGQEHSHSHVHDQFNKTLQAHGYNYAKLDQLSHKYIGMMNSMPKKLALAVTAAMEHFTAILANAILSDDAILRGMHAKMKTLFRWHAVEEIEHKAVAFDVFERVSGSYSLRILGMLLASLDFMVFILIFTGFLLAKDGQLFRWRTAASSLRFFFTQPGIFRRIVPAYLRYYAPSFHPWNTDDSHLLQDMRQFEAS